MYFLAIDDTLKFMVGILGGILAILLAGMLKTALPYILQFLAFVPVAFKYFIVHWKLSLIIITIIIMVTAV